MLGIALYAVVGGGLLGAVTGWLMGSHWPTRRFILAGALGGGIGLILYDLIAITMQTPFKFFWDGLSWAAFGAVFALALLMAMLSGQHEPNRR